MLLITIEKINATTRERTTLGEGTITNDGILSEDTNGKRGDYDIEIRSGTQRRAARILNFPRHKAVWELLYLGLQQIHSKPKSK